MIVIDLSLVPGKAAAAAAPGPVVAVSGMLPVKRLWCGCTTSVW